MCSNGNAAIFLDRDGTINEDVGHLKDASDVVFLPGTFDALRMLTKHFLLFIVTNQPGVAEGAISRKDVKRVNAHLVNMLGEAGIEITDVYVCPHRRSDNCVCIKPKPYFVQKAAKDYCIDLQRSFVVGDHPHDIQLARNVGAQGIYVLTGHGRKHVAKVPDDTEIVPGIMEAAKKITRRCYHERPKCSHKHTQRGFILNLGIACNLWRRPDLGHEPEHAKHVAEVLLAAGIEVYEVSGGWLECAQRPAGIWEALTGSLAPAEWVRQFSCPPEQPGQVLRLLADRGIPVKLLDNTEYYEHQMQDFRKKGGPHGTVQQRRQIDYSAWSAEERHKRDRREESEICRN
jgi:D-glycero-D-manno-heptose 1,7-bisphosphate phosphatase